MNNILVRLFTVTLGVAIGWVLGTLGFMSNVASLERDAERKASSVKNHPSSNPNRRRTERPDMGTRRVNPNSRTAENPWFHMAHNTKEKPDTL